MLPSAGRSLRLDRSCWETSDLQKGRNPSPPGNSSLVLVCTGPTRLELLCSSERRTSLEVWGNPPELCWSLEGGGADKGWSPALKVLVLLAGEAGGGQPPGAVQPGQQTHGGGEGPRVRLLVLVWKDSHR